MARFRQFGLSVALLCVPCAAFAAAQPKSVYHFSPVIDGSVIAAASLGNLIPNVMSSELITPKCPCDIGQVNAFDRIAIGNNSQFAGSISDVTLGLAIVGPPVLDFLALGATRALVEDLVIYAEVLSVNGAFLTLAKYTVQRPLPVVYSGQDPALLKDPAGYRSFYSGHVSTTFAALTATAVTANLRYHSGILPWIIAVGVGGSVAYERVAAGRHFPTDVIMGAVAGSANGIIIPLLHANPKVETPVQLTLSPQWVGLGWKKTF